MTETPLSPGTDRPAPADRPRPADSGAPTASDVPGDDERAEPGPALAAGPGDGDQVAPALDVYWRPGCGYCGRLFRSLERAGVAVRRINIWEDDEARRFVRAHNRGNETVPTVDLGGRVRTNPQPDDLIAEIRADHPAMVGEPASTSSWWSRRQR